MNIILRYYNYLKTWRQHRDTIKQLNKLSDKELDDIGISRINVNQLIWLDSDRKQRGNL